MVDTAALLRMGQAQASAEQSNAVSRALNAHRLGLNLDADDCQALSRAKNMLGSALEASRASDISTHVRTSLSGGQQTLELIREVSAQPDAEELSQIADVFSEILKGARPDESLVRSAHALFRQLTRRALQSFRAVQPEPEPLIPNPV